MAIAGLLVHTLEGQAQDVEQVINQMDGVTSYGIHNNDYIVVVAEFHSDVMEDEIDKIKGVDAVLTIYTTYVTIEDEA